MLIRFALADGARMAARAPNTITLTIVTRDVVFIGLSPKSQMSCIRVFIGLLK
jgi:hypothetical protein